MSSRIIATAAKAPDQVITNDDLAKIVDTSDEWIVQRTGIRSRHISNGENTSVFVIRNTGLWYTVFSLHGSERNSCYQCCCI